MKCGNVRIFFSQIAEKSVLPLIPPMDMDFLANNGYINVMKKDDYNRGLAEISTLTQMSNDLMNQRITENNERTHLHEDERKTHSITFLFEDKENKEAQKEEIDSHKETLLKIEADIATRGAQINELIKKKSIFDRMVPYNGEYISLTGPGIMMLNDLNIRNYRVSEQEFSEFRDEIQATFSEMRSIAQIGSYHFTNLYPSFPGTDSSQLWSLSIGLAKLQGDPKQIGQRFLFAFDLLRNFDSTIEDKMMVGEIMAASKTSQIPTNSDILDLSESLIQLDHKLRHEANVPSMLSTGIAATILYGRRYDGTFPTDRFVEFSKITASYESAAILAVFNLPSDQLVNKFQAYRYLFSSWGFEMSEDTELASAFLSISDFRPEDVRSKLTIIENGLRNYLEYPLVAAAILASVPTLEANELLNLMEKAYFLLGSYVKNLERSEMISLAVRMIHGIRNEIVKELDPTAAVLKTPVQFTYVPTHVFFFYYAPLIIAHSSYHSTFSGIGGYHPAHVHGVGGFMG
jgi:hypothetical protein